MAALSIRRHQTLNTAEKRNDKYLFVASVTLACRAAIAGGMEAERAYNISDLYILKIDQLRSAP